MATGRLYLLCLGVGLMCVGTIKQLNEAELVPRFRETSSIQEEASLESGIENLNLTHEEGSEMLSETMSLQDKNTSKPTDCPDMKPVSIKWHRFSESNSQLNVRLKEKVEKPAKKKLVIGLMSGYDPYAQLLEVTGRINKAYALKYKHDVLVLQGTYLVIPSDNCDPPKRRATFNKIGLLKEALRHRDRYDQLLILDTDAMMYNMSFDVTTLLDGEPNEDENGAMLAAHRVRSDDVLHTWDVNIGVTLWNLHHPRTHAVARSWEKLSRKTLGIDGNTGDQSKLHAVLKNEAKHIHALEEEFAYGHGSVIRHYIRRRSNKQWKDPDVLANRVQLLQEAADEVCQIFPVECQSIDALAL